MRWSVCVVLSVKVGGNLLCSRVGWKKTPIRTAHLLALVNSRSPSPPLTPGIRPISPHWVHPSRLPGRASPVGTRENASLSLWSPAARPPEQGCPLLGFHALWLLLPLQGTSSQQGITGYCLGEPSVITRVSRQGGDVRGGGGKSGGDQKTECDCLCRCWKGQEPSSEGASRDRKKQEMESFLEPPEGDSPTGPSWTSAF